MVLTGQGQANAGIFEELTADGKPEADKRRVQPREAGWPSTAVILPRGGGGVVFTRGGAGAWTPREAYQNIGG